MPTLPVYILDKDNAVGTWLLNQLNQIKVTARWLPTVRDLVSEAEAEAPSVCLIAIRPPVAQALALITNLTQEPRFSRTAFILMGPQQYKHAAFEAGADDYLTTPPDVIELRKRVRLYLDRAVLEDRMMAENRISQEMEQIIQAPSDDLDDALAGAATDSVTLLEHTAALTRERNLLDMMLQHVGLPLIFVDPTGRLRYANLAWQRLIGRGAAEFIGQHITWPPQTGQARTNQLINAAIADRQPWHGEITHTLPNGRRLDVEMSISPVLDVTQELVGFVVVQNDVGHRKALDELKTRFLSDAAFEMRTPVTNIKMRQYLLRQAPPEQHPMHLEALERETTRLSHMLDAMLELSRLDAGLIELNQESVDLNRLVNDAITRYGPSAQEHGITLAFAPSSELPAVIGDPALLARTIGIVLENAIHHTPEGGHVAVSLKKESWTGGEFVTLAVQDTGIGITPEALGHIFERFYRSERSRDSGIRGVGLGLAIAHEIIQRHNGDLTVESRVNEGSTFTLWLPIVAP